MVRLFDIWHRRRNRIQHTVFSEARPLSGTLAALGTYAAGFFARPVGGVLFGRFGDRIDL
jgi:nitrate/nitrite transporter NarK